MPASVAGAWAAVRKRVDADIRQQFQGSISDEEIAERITRTMVVCSMRELGKDMGRDASTAQRHLAAAVAAGVLVAEKGASRGATRVGLAVSSLPVRSASAGVFPRAEDLEAARDDWDATQARIRTERLLAAMDGPAEEDDPSAGPARAET